jgi:hypothetical protein
MPDEDKEDVECMEVKFERKDGDDLYPPSVEKQMVDVMAKEIQKEIDAHIFKQFEEEIERQRLAELERQRKVLEQRRERLDAIVRKQKLDETDKDIT